jgi:hypothetical protein
MVEDMLSVDTGAWPRMAGLRGIWADPMGWAGCTRVQVSGCGHRHDEGLSREVLSHHALSASRYGREASTTFTTGDSAVDLETIVLAAAVAGAGFHGGMRAHSILTGGGTLVRPTTRTGNVRLAWPTR